MIRSAHTDQQAAIRHPFDQRLNLGLLRTKRLFHIERHFHERAASARVLDCGCKGLFFRHYLYLSFILLGTSFFPPIHTPTIVAKVESRKPVNIAVSK